MELSRRHLLGSLGAGAGTAVLAGWAAPSLGRATAPGPAARPAVAPNQAVTGKPYETLLPTLPRGGTLQYAFIGAEPPHLDSQLTRSGRTLITSDPINDWLVRYDVDGTLVPSLASSFEQVDDLTLRFTLRPGIKFHNGRELTSEDVKKTIEWVQNPDSLSAYAGEMSVIESVETPAPDTAILHLTAPTPVLIHSLTRIAIRPLEVIETQGDMKTNPVGAGPFRFKEWRQGEAIEVERFPEYWDPEAPRLDGIVFRYIPDERSTIASFEAGEIHAIRGIGNAAYFQLSDREDDGIHVLAQPSLNWGYLAMNQARPPFDNVLVRRAIARALDRNAFNESGHLGLSIPAWFPVLKDSPYYPTDLEQPSDLDEARRLLAEAGFPDGFSTNVLIPTSPFEEPFGVILQQQLGEIGIDVQIEVLETAAFLQRTLADKDYDLTMLSDAGSPDPATFLNQYFKTGGGSNLTGYSNPTMDDLLTRASSTYDEVVRTDLYRQVFELLVEDAPMPILLWYTITIAWRDPVLGEHILSNPENFRNNWPAVAMNAE